ncbi:hypothetical protein T484DRAFT_1818813 [Baffinella frigidus]|nr:hypothetical protein T484DRAFT_1818813 [Cryptophyta sp. CCMP2293]
MQVLFSGSVWVLFSGSVWVFRRPERDWEGSGGRGHGGSSNAAASLAALKKGVNDMWTTPGELFPAIGSCTQSAVCSLLS